MPVKAIRLTLFAAKPQDFRSWLSFLLFLRFCSFFPKLFAVFPKMKCNFIFVLCPIHISVIGAYTSIKRLVVLTQRGENM